MFSACAEIGDVVFVLDGSGSVGQANFNMMKDFVVSLLEGTNVNLSL